MTVPSESSVHVEATLMGKAGDNVLDGASKDVAVVWQACGEWRAIVEGVPK